MKRTYNTLSRRLVRNGIERGSLFGCQPSSAARAECGESIKAHASEEEGRGTITPGEWRGASHTAQSGGRRFPELKLVAVSDGRSAPHAATKRPPASVLRLSLRVIAGGLHAAARS